MSSPGEIWDRRFAEQRWPIDPDRHLAELAGPLPVGRGIDLGAGPGRNSLWLAAKDRDITLVDASDVCLAQAARSAQALGTSVATIEADLAAWHPDRAD